MSDNYMDDDFDSDEIEEQPQGDPGDIKSLRRAANSKKKLEQENLELKRRLAFVEAGISMADPKMKYFIKGYDGEMEADAIRAAAMEAGFLASQSQGDDPGLAAAAAAQNRVMQASSGVAFEGMTEDAALAQLEAAMEEGGIEAMLDVARQFGIPTNIEQ